MEIIQNPFEVINSRLANIENLLSKVFQPSAQIIEKPDLTDITGASEVTGLSKSTIYQRGDRLPRIKTPKKVVFSRKALNQWVLDGMPDVSMQKAANDLALAVQKNPRLNK
jgi:hypothetical protein